MRIALKQFGTILVSRPAGKEAFLALQARLKEIKTNEKIEIDFEGVIVLTPSWADEFITPLREIFKERIIMLNKKNPSVIATLETLEKAKKYKQTSGGDAGN